MSSSTDRVIVGLIGKPFGMGGHVTVRVESDDPDRFHPGARFPGPAGDVLVVDEVREAEKGIHLRFAGHHTREAAESLRGHELTIDAAERRALSDGEYWPDQLIGLRVIEPTGGEIGIVVDFVEGHAQDRLKIRAEDGREFEVPFVFDLVPDVDLGAATVTIQPIPGLTD
ncbi:MAG TPA: ribosome maturation factor RimM [Acidimicrobiia bacterium]